MKESDLTAEDLGPLVAKLSPKERVRLAYLALSIRARAAEASDAGIYERTPPAREEFSPGDWDPMSWDGEGWDDVA